MDQRLQRGQIKPKRPYKRKNVSEISSRGVTKKTKRRKDSAASLQIAKQITKRPYNKKQKDPQFAVPHKGRPSSAASQQGIKNQNNLIHIEVGTTQVKQNTAKNSQFNPKGLVIIDKLSEFANNYLQNPPRNEEPKKKKKLIEEAEWDVLNDRKKKYFEIVNNYPYLKSQEENSNKEKQKKQNEIITENNQEEICAKKNEENKNQMDLENVSKAKEENNNKAKEENNNKTEDENNNKAEKEEEKNNLIEEENNNQVEEESNHKAEQQSILRTDQKNHSMSQQQEIQESIEKRNEIKLENSQDQMKEERVEKIEEVVEQNVNNKGNQIVIVDDEVKEEPKQEECNLELLEVKEEENKQIEQLQSDQNNMKIKEVQNQENILVIEEKIEENQQVEPVQASKQDPLQEMNKTASSTSDQEFDLIQNLIKNNINDVQKVAETKISSLLENQENLSESIKNESFMVKLFQTMKNLVTSYIQCLDQKDPSYEAYINKFFQFVFNQAKQVLEQINCILQLKDEEKLIIDILYHRYQQKLKEVQI
ncbi:hypothetical protein TTHERM_00149330 (macronuclear) [Tetrahymena thermophila SB210]|uniref:Uncharacterized protein n=1 Tax=Tetrahymena thermophila (strain SB210) TaxID=312017 RepID=I7LWB6_TETTS|nr:hypothetical protein TTHERM_00149330 [Tetrahymena thermophila SB210]EAS01323.1 hypothetical protein TTHERM_00149330 [Tetrahymena thermophila SB210]|eukprot:XP_001021568.1 hypothetical protein TTHERM_00149330 [Tetrahymena thermophila SB210]